MKRARKLSRHGWIAEHGGSITGAAVTGAGRLWESRDSGRARERSGLGPASRAIRPRTSQSEAGCSCGSHRPRKSFRLTPIATASTTRAMPTAEGSNIRTGLHPGFVWSGNENTRHPEHVSVLLRDARQEHGRLVEPAVVAAVPLLPGARAPVPASRVVLRVSVLMCRSTTSTRSRLGLVHIPIRSTSTGCTAAEARHARARAPPAKSQSSGRRSGSEPAHARSNGAAEIGFTGSAATASRRPRS